MFKPLCLLDETGTMGPSRRICLFFDCRCRSPSQISPQAVCNGCLCFRAANTLTSVSTKMCSCLKVPQQQVEHRLPNEYESEVHPHHPTPLPARVHECVFPSHSQMLCTTCVYLRVRVCAYVYMLKMHTQKRACCPRHACDAYLWIYYKG